MELKIFLIVAAVFIGGGLLCLFFLNSVLKSAKPSVYIVYGILFSLISSIVGWAVTFVSGGVVITYWLFCIFFLVAGIVHVLMTHKKYFEGAHENSTVRTGEFMLTVAVGFITIGLLSVLVYFLSKDGRDFDFYPTLLSGLVFFVPLFFVYMFTAALTIPFAEYSTWFYPVSSSIDPPEENPNERLLVIGFMAKKRALDAEKALFRAKAPESIILGELYYHFINDYNELQSETPIDVFNDTKGVQEWWFRIKNKWYQPTVILDPSLTLVANGIKEDTVIICERM